MNTHSQGRQICGLCAGRGLCCSPDAPEMWLVLQAQELQQENRGLREELAGVQATILQATRDADAWLNKAHLAYAMNHTLRQSAQECGAHQGLQVRVQGSGFRVWGLGFGVDPGTCTDRRGCGPLVLGMRGRSHDETRQDKTSPCKAPCSSQELEAELQAPPTDSVVSHLQSSLHLPQDAPKNTPPAGAQRPVPCRGPTPATCSFPPSFLRTPSTAPATPPARSCPPQAAARATPRPSPWQPRTHEPP